MKASLDCICTNLWHWSIGVTKPKVPAKCQHAATGKTGPTWKTPSPIARRGQKIDVLLTLTVRSGESMCRPEASPRRISRSNFEDVSIIGQALQFPRAQGSGLYWTHGHLTHLPHCCSPLVIRRLLATLEYCSNL